MEFDLDMLEFPMLEDMVASRNSPHIFSTWRGHYT